MNPSETRVAATPNSDAGSALDLLRHAIATLAYRAGRAVQGAPAGFAQFRVSATTRTPGEILAHVGDLLDWAGRLADGAQEWHDSVPLSWDQELARFFAGLNTLDTRLSSGGICSSPQCLFQGPIADALTHIGQIAMLRRLVGSPVRGENYSKADIVAGRVGPTQSRPRKSFD